MDTGLTCAFLEEGGGTRHDIYGRRDEVRSGRGLKRTDTGTYALFQWLQTRLAWQADVTRCEQTPSQIKESRGNF